MDFAPFVMAHTPLKMTISEAREEVQKAWSSSYSAKRNRQALKAIQDAPIQYRIGMLVSRLFSAESISRR